MAWMKTPPAQRGSGKASTTRTVSKQDFGNTKGGGYQARKVEGLRDKEFYTVQAFLIKK
jgi:hypothetical protein